MLVANLRLSRGGLLVCGGFLFLEGLDLGGEGKRVHFGEGHPVCFVGPAGGDAAVAGV